MYQKIQKTRWPLKKVGTDTYAVNMSGTGLIRNKKQKQTVKSLLPAAPELSGLPPS